MADRKQKLMTETQNGVIWLTVPEAQAYLKVSKPTIYALMKDGRLPFYYIAGTRQRRIKRTDLDALLRPGRPEDVNEEDEEAN